MHLTRSSRVDPAPARLDRVDSGDMSVTSSTVRSVVFTGKGGDPRWLGATLRLRVDEPSAAVSDMAATSFLGGNHALQRELVHLTHGDAGGLDQRLVAKEGRELVPAIRATHAVPPPGTVTGDAVIVELRPGSGLRELYGQPGSFSVNESGALRANQAARTGKYNARDFFSNRPARLRQALWALTGDQQDRLCIKSGEQVIFPVDTGTTATLDAQLQLLGLGGLSTVIETVAALCEGEGAPLLTRLTQAQCTSADVASASAAQSLHASLAEHSSGKGGEPLLSQEALGQATARGFWTLPADESGMKIRHREAAQLLERARRELWSEGSASRAVLETEIRKYLCLYWLGVAATEAVLRVTFVRSSDKDVSQSALYGHGFKPVIAVPGFWCRLELTDVEVPANGSL